MLPFLILFHNLHFPSVKLKAREDQIYQERNGIRSRQSTAIQMLLGCKARHYSLLSVAATGGDRQGFFDLFSVSDLSPRLVQIRTHSIAAIQRYLQDYPELHLPSPIGLNHKRLFWMHHLCTSITTRKIRRRFPKQGWGLGFLDLSSFHSP